MNRLFILLAFLFAGFLFYVIYSANQSADFYFVKWVRALPYGDKIGHFLLMGIMTLLINLALRNRTFSLFNKNILWGSSIIFIIITIEEFTQISNPNRTFDVLDLSANYLGIFCFSMAAIFVHPYIFKKE